MDMIRGQKVKVADITANSTNLTVELQINAAFTIDFSLSLIHISEPTRPY